MTHRHYGDDDALDRCFEIDAAVCLRPAYHGGDPDVTDADGQTAGGPNEHLSGFIFAHDRPGLEWRCEGYVNIDTDRPGRHVWTMSGSLEGRDLTLNPSILCRLGSVSTEECGFHGWVRDGKWISV